MTSPTNDLPEDLALLAIGAVLLTGLREARTVSELWSDVRDARASASPVSYATFVLALDVLFAFGAVDLVGGQLRRTVRASDGS